MRQLLGVFVILMLMVRRRLGNLDMSSCVGCSLQSSFAKTRACRIFLKIILEIFKVFIKSKSNSLPKNDIDKNFMQISLCLQNSPSLWCTVLSSSSELSLWCLLYLLRSTVYQPKYLVTILFSLIISIQTVTQDLPHR